MATTTQTGLVPELRDGDRLTVAEFERRYHAAPHIKKAELIEGLVFVASPVLDEQSQPHAELTTWLGLYRIATPHVIVASDGTIRLDMKNQPQPDVHPRIAADHGGQASRSEDGYVVGAPELVAEIAVSSAARDLGPKLEAYRRNGVREAIIWRVRDRAIDWFILRDGRFERLEPGEGGLTRSEVFPGLWLDPEALLRGDLVAVAEVVGRGLASPKHGDFVEALKRAGPR